MHNIFGKTYNWRQVYVQTSSNFYKIRAHTFLYKSVKVHTLTAIFKTALKTWILQLQHLRKMKMYFYLILFHCFLPLDYVSTYSIYFMLFKSELSKKDLLGLIKRRSKVHQQNTPYKCAFNFWPMKTILQKFVFTWLFNAQKSYPTSLEKIIILKTTCKIFIVNYHNCKKAKHELRVASYEFSYAGYEFKSTSYEFQSRS